MNVRLKTEIRSERKIRAVKLLLLVALFVLPFWLTDWESVRWWGAELARR